MTNMQMWLLLWEQDRLFPGWLLRNQLKPLGILSNKICWALSVQTVPQCTVPKKWSDYARVMHRTHYCAGY